MSVTEQQPDNGTPRPKPPRRLGLSGKLLLLTIPLVMIAEILIYVPAIANFRMNRLNDRLAAANTAALVLDAAPSGAVPDLLARQILTSIGARAVAIKMGQQRRLLASADMPQAIDHDVDMREMTAWSAIVDLRDHARERQQTIRVVGPAPGGAQFIEVVIDESPLRQAMYRFSRNLLAVSLGIGALTAGLVYLALHFLVRAADAAADREPDRLPREPGKLGAHHRAEPARRRMGSPERELSDMQRDLVSMLHRKSRLAALGLAVSKINHDLQQPAGVFAAPCPTSSPACRIERVQRFAPKLMRSLERAIAFCPVDAVLRPRPGGRPRPPHDADTSP